MNRFFTFFGAIALLVALNYIVGIPMKWSIPLVAFAVATLWLGSRFGVSSSLIGLFAISVILYTTWPVIYQQIGQNPFLSSLWLDWDGFAHVRKAQSVVDSKSSYNAAINLENARLGVITQETPLFSRSGVELLSLGVGTKALLTSEAPTEQVQISALGVATQFVRVEFNSRIAEGFVFYHAVRDDGPLRPIGRDSRGEPVEHTTTELAEVELTPNTCLNDPILKNGIWFDAWGDDISSVSYWCEIESGYKYNLCLSNGKCKTIVAGSAEDAEILPRGTSFRICAAEDIPITATITKTTRHNIGHTYDSDGRKQ